MKFVLMCLLLLVGLNQIVARFLPKYIFNYENEFINGFDEFDEFYLGRGTEESKEIQVHVPVLEPDDDMFEGLANGLMRPSEGFTHDDDYNDDIETEEKKSGEETPKEEAKEIEEEDEKEVKEQEEEEEEEEVVKELEEEKKEVNLEGSESTEMTLNKNVEEEIANNFFNAVLFAPFMLGEIMSDIDHNNKKIDSSSEFSTEYMNEKKGSEEETIDNSMIVETVPATNSYGENSIDGDENIFVKEIEDLSLLLSKLRTEYIGNKIHNKYTDEEMLKRLLHQHIIDEVNRAVNKFLEYDNDERITTHVSSNDEDEEDDNNDVLTTTEKNDRDYEYDDSIEYDDRDEFSTTTESNSSEDDDYRTSAPKIDSDIDEDDDESDDGTAKTINIVEKDDDELIFIPMDFYGISGDADSQKNLNNQKYEVVTSSDSDNHTSSPTSVRFSADDHKLFAEYSDLSKNLDNQQSSLINNEVKLKEDFLDIIYTHYDDDSLNKFENDIRVLHGNLDKFKGYINAMENLHSKMYLRKILTAAIKEVQDKSNK